jgi:hypothetical protein
MLTRNASSERIVEGLAFRRPLLFPGAQSQERLWAGGSGKTSQGLPDTVSASHPQRGAATSISPAVPQGTKCRSQNYPTTLLPDFDMAVPQALT